MNDTPLTDGRAFYSEDTSHYGEVVEAKFARALERRVKQLYQALVRLQRAADNLESGMVMDESLLADVDVLILDVALDYLPRDWWDADDALAKATGASHE